MQGRDLGEISRNAARIRKDNNEAVVLLEISVVIDSDPRGAHAAVASSDVRLSSAGLVYVGTPRGLVGLISDIDSLGIADAAVLIPKSARVEQLIREAVLPAARLPITVLHAVGRPGLYQAEWSR